MKTKEYQGYKRTLAFAVSILFSLLVICICTFACFAEENNRQEDFLVENYNLSEKYSILLSEEINKFSELDTDAQKSVSKNVTNVINLYRKSLLDLQSHPDAGKRLLSKEAAVIYSQGCAAGRLAFIYYYNIPSVKAARADALKKLYTDFCEEISKSDDSAVLDARIVAISADMNKAFYVEFTESLGLDTDSPAVKSIIAGSLKELENKDDSDLFAKELSAHLRATQQELKLQRSRDFITHQLELIFPIIRNGEDLQSSDAAPLFDYEIRNSLSIAEMNECLRNTVCKLLAVPQSNRYERLFVSELCESISAATAKASKESECADLLPLFENYTLLISKAKTKDGIYSILFSSANYGDETLKQLEEVFNGENGKVEQCSARETLSAEIYRATSAKALYSVYLSVKESLEVVLKPYQPKDFSDRAKIIYDEAASKIMKAENSSELQSECEATVSVAEEKLAEILKEGKAQRFLLDHKDMIQKPTDKLTVADEAALGYALTDFTSLEPQVCAALSSQINSIAEKYKTVLCLKIRLLRPDDALYLDVCENICAELRTMSKSNIAEFYNNCSLVFSKATVLRSVINEYRTVCADEIYENFNSGEREKLARVCYDSADTLCKINIKDTATFSDRLGETLENAKLDMARILETGRIRISCKDSKNTEIKSLAAEAGAKINASGSVSDIENVSRKTIFKINRILTADEMELRAEEERYRIKNMKFLSEDEKTAFDKAIYDLKNSLKEEASIAENLTVLNFIRDNFNDGLSEIRKNADASDLSKSLKSYGALLRNDADLLRGEIDGMVHLSAEKSAEYLNKIESLTLKFKTDSASATSSLQVETIYKEILDLYKSIRISASEENLSNYKVILLSKLESMLDCKERYSAENYNLIVEKTEEAKNELDLCGSISACNSLLSETEKSINLIDDLLDDAKNQAKKELDGVAAQFKQISYLYSSENMAKILLEISEAKEAVKKYTEIDQIPQLKETVLASVAAAKAVKKDYITSCPSGLGFLSEGAGYPLQYDFSNGYWGLIYSQNSLPYGSELSIKNAVGADVSAIEKAVRSAAKSGSIKVYGKPLKEEEIKLLKKCNVALALDISASNLTSSGSKYTLQMLLPSYLKSENVLGIVFTDGENNVEFYNIEKEEMLISTELSHFSNYYIVSQNTINLKPIIIFLSILLIAEIAVLALLIFIRFYRKRKEKNMFPLLPAFFINPSGVLGVSRVTPSGAVSTVILLCAAVLALGCGIALMAKTELAENRRRPKGKDEPQKDDKKGVENEIRELKEESKPLLKAKVYSLKAAEDNGEEEIFSFSQPQEETELCAVAVKSEKIDAEVENVSPENGGINSNAEFRPKHRVEINLDIIAEKFSDGDLVTLEGLKRKHLIPKNTDYVKVLARGSLSKPLTVEAHDFSHAAEELLKSLGGEAIRIKSKN